MVAYVAYHYLGRKTSGHTSMVALKLDIVKTYDQVEWAYLFYIL